MPIRFRCAYCNQLLGIARRKVGTVVRCPTCAGQVVVPDRDAEGLGDDAAEQPLFERNDFDDLFSLPGNGDSPRALASQPQASPRVVEPAGSWGTHAEPEFDIERLHPTTAAAPRETETTRPPGVHLSPLIATLLTVGVIAVFAASFLAGLLVGYVIFRD
jgi:DNA-directed RNA polymerase subunit RPC12/RpoP